MQPANPASIPGRAFGLLMFTLLCVQPHAREFIPLWPEGQMPNSKGMSLEQLEERERITQVAMPHLLAFFPSQEEITGTAVMICPPGGYRKLTYNIAGEQWAKWLNTLGITAFVLIHRLPTSPDLLEPQLAPLQDAQRAMKLIRSRAAEWKLDPDRIGVMGASAGGHLAACLSTFETDHARIGDAFDPLPFRPDFQMLISPVIDMGEHAHPGSREALLGEAADADTLTSFSVHTRVTARTPPALLIHAHDDPTARPINSVLYYTALLDRGVSASLHIFPHGEHAIALRNNPGSTALWPALAEAWLREMDLLPAPQP